MLFRIGMSLLAFVMVAVLAVPTADAKRRKKDEGKVFDFEGDTIETDYLKPDAAMVESIVRQKRASLIKIRTDFVNEIVKSAEDI